MRSLVVLLFFLPLVAGIPSGEGPRLSSEDIEWHDQEGQFVIAAWEDGRGSLSGNTPKNTWAIWKEEQRLRTETAASVNCANFGSCVSEVKGVALGENNRFAVAATDAGVFQDSRLIAGTHQNGITQRISINNQEILTFAASPSLEFIVIATAETDGGGQWIRQFRWTGSNPGQLTEQWAVETTGTSTMLGVANDGAGAYFAKNNNDRTFLLFNAAGSTYESTITSDVTSLDALEESWALAGLADGRILVYGQDSYQQPYAPEMELHPFDDDITLATWIDESKFVVADNAGRAITIHNLAHSFVENEILSTSTGEHLVDIQFSGDQVARLTEDELTLETLEGETLWMREGTGKSVRFEENGLVTLATASGLIPFHSVHEISITSPSLEIENGATEPFEITVINNGNRGETVEFSIQSDTGLQVSTLNQIEIDAGETKKIAAQASVAKGLAAGDYAFTVSASGQHFVTETTTSSVSVPVEESWDLISNSADTIGVQGGDLASFEFSLVNNGNEKLTPALELAPTNWGAEMQFAVSQQDPGQSKNGVILVSVPEDAASGSVEELELSLGEEKLSWTLIVDASHGVQVSSQDAGTTIVQGDVSTIQVQLKNTGNGEDSFFLNVDGLPDGITAVFEDDVLQDVPSAQQVVVQLSFVADEDVEIGTHVISISGTSIGDTRFTDSASVLLTVNPLVEESSTSTSENQESPTVGMLLPLILLGILVKKRR